MGLEIGPHPDEFVAFGSCCRFMQLAIGTVILVPILGVALANLQ